MPNAANRAKWGKIERTLLSREAKTRISVNNVCIAESSETWYQSYVDRRA